MGSYSDSDERVRVRWRRDSSNRSLAATALVNWDGACTAEWFPYMLTQGEVTYDYVTSTFTSNEKSRENACPPLPRSTRHANMAPKKNERSWQQQQP